jgi:hypothetical protein
MPLVDKNHTVPVRSGTQQISDTRIQIAIPTDQTPWKAQKQEQQELMKERTQHSNSINNEVKEKLTVRQIFNPFQQEKVSMCVRVACASGSICVQIQICQGKLTPHPTMCSTAYVKKHF